MEPINPKQVVYTIEEILAKSKAVPSTMVSAAESTNEQARPAESQPAASTLAPPVIPAPVPMVSLYGILDQSALNELRRWETVDQPRGSGPGLLIKKVLGRLFKFISGPQAAFNRKTIEALEISSGHVDLLSRRSGEDVHHLQIAVAELRHENAQLREALQNLIDRTVALGKQSDEQARMFGARLDEVTLGLTDQTTQQSNLAGVIEELRKDLAEKAPLVETDRIWAEVPRVYDAINGRATWEELGKAFKGIEERAAGSDVAKIWEEEIPKLYSAIDVRASQNDVAELWAQLGNAFKAIDARAAGTDVAKLWEEEIPKLYSAINVRASQQDVADLWVQIEKAFKAIDERAAGTEVARLWDELQKVFASIESRVHHDTLAALLADIPKNNDLKSAWRQIEKLNQSITDQVAGVWKGIEQRDSQLISNTVAIQELHVSAASLETAGREVRARLMVLAEQISLQQEQLDEATLGQSSAPTPLVLREETPNVAEVAGDILSPTNGKSGAVDTGIQRLFDLAYHRFQYQYRGDEADLRQRQQRYVKILGEKLPNSHGRILDAACGDGIFVELLTKNGWNASGVDLSKSMVRKAQERGMVVAHADAIQFLESHDSQAFDAISSFQFVEHLPPPALMRFLRGALQALAPGGILLLETINPHTLKSLHWFHLDLTHCRLVFPEMLQILAETCGFVDCEWVGINPVDGSQRLVESADSDDNGNTKRLNEFLFGNQDYYFIAKRPTRNL